MLGRVSGNRTHPVFNTSRSPSANFHTADADKAGPAWMAIAIEFRDCLHQRGRYQCRWPSVNATPRVAPLAAEHEGGHRLNCTYVDLSKFVEPSLCVLLSGAKKFSTIFHRSGTQPHCFCPDRRSRIGQRCPGDVVWVPFRLWRRPWRFLRSTVLQWPYSKSM